VFEQLREWRRISKRDTRVSYLALRDPRAPWYVKALAAAMAVYVLSPVDLIPDFLPLHGIIDDIIVVPVAIALMVRLIPMPLKAELQEKAEARMAEKRPHSHIGEAIIIFCLVGIAAIVVWLIWFR
jgi:uncharacterized membrane protein YkvA (DUF1232 family)